MEARIYQNAWLTMEASATAKEQAKMNEYLHQAMQEELNKIEQEKETN